MNFHKDLEVIERAKQGDEEAFTILYETYYASLLATAYRLTNNQEDAKDALQNAFIQMHKSIHNLKEPKYFRLWMNKIVRGKCIDIFHKNRDVLVDTGKEEVINHFKEDHSTYLPEEQFKFESDRSLLMDMIHELPYTYQEVLVYAYLSQFTMQEISELLDIPVGTVKSRLYSAKKALRTKVEEYERFHHYKLTFHLPGAITLALMLGYGKLRTAYKFPKQSHFSTISMMSGIKVCCIGGVLLSGVVIGSKYVQNQSPEQLMKTNVDAKELNEQDAYFKLMDWAFDEVQMSKKTKEEIQDILPVYTYLKQSQGPFWKRLEQENWNIVYENLKNN